jgi:hypothetical protein
MGKDKVKAYVIRLSRKAELPILNQYYYIVNNTQIKVGEI